MTSPLPPPGAPDFESWLAAHEDALQRTAHLLTGNVHAAQDLVQNTLAKLYRDGTGSATSTTSTPTPAGRWSTSSARRGAGRAAGPSRSWRWSPTAPAPGSRSYDESREAVWSFVCSLPPKQRTVVVLRFYDQLTEAEIADLMGISVGTVKSQSSRAVASLRASTARPS